MGDEARWTAATVAAAASAAALAGCAMSPEVRIGAVTPVQISNAAQSRPAARLQDVDIRTMVQRAGVEVSGARCEAASRDVSAQFTSPARLRLPLYGAETAPLLVTCEHPTQGRATMSISPKPEKDGVFALLGGVFGDDDQNGARAYDREYKLSLARGAGPAAPPPKPSSVSSRPLPPIEGLPAAP